MTRKAYFQRYNVENRGKVKRVTLRFSPVHHAALSEKAAEDEMLLAPFLRQALLRELGEPVLSTKTQRELADITWLLRNIANNFNQMARYAHREGAIFDEDEPLKELRRLESHLRSCIERLSGGSGG